MGGRWKRGPQKATLVVALALLTGGSAFAASLGRQTRNLPHNATRPVVRGVPRNGNVLRSTPGRWLGAPRIAYRFRWLRCNRRGVQCIAIKGATRSVYRLTGRDVGSTVRSRVTASSPLMDEVATPSARAVSARSKPTRVVGAAETPIFWGAIMDGNDTYDHLFGGTWGDAPWDAKTWNRFESDAGKRVSLVQWGLGTPWATDFASWLGAFDQVRARGDLSVVDMTTGSVPLRTIAAGRYDRQIGTWMRQAAAYGRPFFLVLDVEMNGNWEPYSPGVNGNTPADFVSMWRHVHDLAVRAGAGNITWVWAPNSDPRHMFTPYGQLYPGDAYVDWTGLDGFNMDGKSPFSWIFGSSYQALQQLAPGKSVMITQVSSVEGGAGKAAWITDALSTQLPQSFPQVKAISWFNWRIYNQHAWWPFEIESSKSAQAAFAAGIASPYYVAGGGFGNLPFRTKIAPP